MLEREARPASGGAEYTLAAGHRNATRAGLAILEAAGLEIPWCATAGKGPPIVMLAGLGWRASGSLRSGSAPPGMAVVGLDYPRRWPRRPLDTVTEIARAYGVALEALGLRRARLLGVSFGGMVALQLALDRPELIESAALVSTAASGAQVAGRWRLPLSRAAARLLPEEAFYLLYRRFGPRLVGTGAFGTSRDGARLWSDPIGRRKMSDLLRAAAVFDVRRRLGDLRCRILVLHGSEDRLIGPEAARVTARGVPGARCVMLEGADHFAFLTHRRQVMKELGEFWSL